MEDESLTGTLPGAPTGALVTPTVSRGKNVGRRYVQAALYSCLGGIVSRVLYGFTPIVLAISLEPTEYGIYALVISSVAMVAGLSHLGQNTALPKLLPEYSVKDPSRGGAILANTVLLVLGALLVVCLAFYFLSGWIASAIYRRAFLTAVFQFSALIVLSMALFNLASSVAAGLQDFQSYSRAQVVRAAALLGLSWVGVQLFGLQGALAGQLLASLLGLALLAGAGLRLARALFPGAVRPVLSGPILGEIFSFAFPGFLISLLFSAAYWWANTFLARQAGFEQVGLFGVAFALAQLVMLVPSNLSIPAVSFMAELHSASDFGEFVRLVSTNLRLIWALTLPLAVGFAIFAQMLIKIFFGPAYVAAVPLALLMTFVALLMVINNVIGCAIVSSGRIWHGFGINLFWLVLFIAAGLFCIPRWGGMGLAVAFATSYLLFTVGLALYCRAVLEMVYEKVVWLTVLSGAGFAAASVVFTWQGTFLYAAALLILLALVGFEWIWVCDASERDTLLRSTAMALRSWTGRFLPGVVFLRRPE